MLPHFSTNKSFGWLLFLTIFVATPVAAHEVKTAQDVGGTFHIEPNDTPTAGKPEIAWFALTQKGGKKIPLEQCNCKLAVHIQPHTEGSPPLLQPPLKEISSKQYKTIPSAKIVFPKAGANFKPFELSYEVTVAPGVAAPTKTNSQAASVPTINAQSEQPDNRWLIPAIAIATILGLGIFGVVWRKLNS